MFMATKQESFSNAFKYLANKSKKNIRTIIKFQDFDFLLDIQQIYKRLKRLDSIIQSTFVRL